MVDGHDFEGSGAAKPVWRGATTANRGHPADASVQWRVARRRLMACPAEARARVSRAKAGVPNGTNDQPALRNLPNFERTVMR